MPIVLSRELRDCLIARARADAPRETCGLISGRDGQALACLPMTNIREGNTRYEMDAAEQFQAISELEDSGLDLYGIYHSHPATEAYPSPTDRALAHYPECVYIIVSLRDPRQPVVRAFRILGAEPGDVYEEVIEIAQSASSLTA